MLNFYFLRTVIKKLIIGLGLSIAIITQGYSQKPLSSKNKVVYDPLFWKTKLKLKKEQCDQISYINACFYKSIKDIKSETSRGEQNALLDKYLYTRSEELWHVLSTRQKQRWQNIQSF